MPAATDVRCWHGCVTHLGNCNGMHDPHNEQDDRSLSLVQADPLIVKDQGSRIKDQGSRIKSHSCTEAIRCTQAFPLYGLHWQGMLCLERLPHVLGAHVYQQQMELLAMLCSTLWLQALAQGRKSLTGVSSAPIDSDLQAAPQVQLLNDLGISTISYDLLGCGDSPAPRPDTYAQLLQTYSPEANYLDMETILQTMTQVRPWLPRCVVLVGFRVQGFRGADALSAALTTVVCAPSSASLRGLAKCGGGRFWDLGLHNAGQRHKQTCSCSCKGTAQCYCSHPCAVLIQSPGLAVSLHSYVLDVLLLLLPVVESMEQVPAAWIQAPYCELADITRGWALLP